jgi:hypothetical protein
VPAPVDHDLHIAAPLNAAGRRPSRTEPASNTNRDAPSEDPGVQAVVENLLQAFPRQVTKDCGYHAILLVSFWNMEPCRRAMARQE